MFAIIGVIVTLFLTIKAIYHLYRVYRLKPFVWMTGNQWAVVTGSTDGIGYEFACQLAHKGYNLMLISRNQQRLELTKRKIFEDLFQCNKPKIQIRTLARNFASLDIYDEIEKFLNTAVNDIFVLVNNVGMSLDYPDNFLGVEYESNPKLNHSIINVNVIGTTRMTELVLPSMIDKGQGLIINISSQASSQVVPMLATYSATKAYVTQLSQCLATEYQSKGITVVTFIPAFVSTKMAHSMSTNFLLPSAKDYVQSALEMIKYKDSFLSTGYWGHTLMDVISVMIRWMFSTQFLAERIHSILKMSREKLIKSKSEDKQFNAFQVFQ